MACASWLMNLGFAAGGISAGIDLTYVVVPSTDPKVIKRSLQKLNVLLDKLDARLTRQKNRLDTGGL